VLEIVQDFRSPNFSSRQGFRPELIVVHGDAGSSDEGTLTWLGMERSKASYHYLVGRDGVVYQLVDEEDKAWHAGVSDWPGCLVKNSVNPTSLGVAFANDGSGREPFEPIQYKHGADLMHQLMIRYGIPLHRIRGHNEVAPGRKTDPWDHFEWDELFRQIGRYSRALKA
jgi:N-acetylmuramoyl-L-alanine amidase